MLYGIILVGCVCGCVHTHRILLLTEELASNSSAGGGSPTSFLTRITCLGLEEPSLKLCSSELQRTNSSPISNCRCSKSAIFISRNINYNINSLLLLLVGIRIIYIYVYIYMYI